MRLTFSYALNAILSVIILYLLLNRNVCPEVNETKVTETVVAQPVDSNKIHSGIATVVVKKGRGASKKPASLPVVEDKPNATSQGDTNNVAYTTADSVTFGLRDTLLDIEVLLAVEGKIIGDPVINYRFLKPSRYDHYINTTEYVSSEKWMRLYAGVNSQITGDFDIGPSGSVVLPRMALDYTYLLQAKQHMVGIKARLFGR